MSGKVLFEGRVLGKFVCIGVWSQFKLGISWGHQSTLTIGPLEIEVEGLLR